MNHGSISDIKRLLAEEGIALKKRFGQNFLVDNTARRRILSGIRREMASLGDPSGDVWEIGPGIGSLTDLLIETGRPLRLFEIDRGIISLLRRRYGSTVAIEEGDFVRTCGPSFQAQGAPAIIVGNLPYSSAAAIVTRIIEEEIPVRSMVFLVQKELADRFQAEVGKKEYSALSILVQNSFITERLFAIGGGAFYPQPEVGSSVIVMRERAPRHSRPVMATASKLARQAFSQRRKALRNSLKEYVQVMEQSGLDSSLRPERLTPQDFIRLAERVLASEGEASP